MLYAIPSNFNEVVFDLYWGYPSSGPDFLDASCLVFSNQYHITTVDFRQNTNKASQNIWHSGDVMDNLNRKGHHTINVKLQQLPQNVTHLFFTLSAWNSPSIGHFKEPSLKFYEASNKIKNLCKTTFNHARGSQAVIMCSVSKKQGAWRIFESGKLSSGNAMNYYSMIQTIQGLIASGV
jgi:stress response protein SCP2